MVSKLPLVRAVVHSQIDDLYDSVDEFAVFYDNMSREARAKLELTLSMTLRNKLKDYNVFAFCPLTELEVETK